MQQTETGKYEWLQAYLLEEAQDNGKEATICCYSSHCNIDEQLPHQGKLECTSASSRKPSIKKQMLLTKASLYATDESFRIRS